LVLLLMTLNTIFRTIFKCLPFFLVSFIELKDLLCLELSGFVVHY
jgi:hypothetical protein